MELTKAIKILTILESRSINNSVMFKKDALMLGIEAMKRQLEHRDHDPNLTYNLLPGETKD